MLQSTARAPIALVGELTGAGKETFDSGRYAMAPVHIFFCASLLACASFVDPLVHKLYLFSLNLVFLADYN